MLPIIPFVSSEVETPLCSAQLMGLSTSRQSREVYPEPVEGLEANGDRENIT